MAYEPHYSFLIFRQRIPGIPNKVIGCKGKTFVTFVPRK